MKIVFIIQVSVKNDFLEIEIHSEDAIYASRAMRLSPTKKYGDLIMCHTVDAYKEALHVKLAEIAKSLE